MAKASTAVATEPALEPTWCSNCDNVVEHTRKKAPWYWQCIKFPRLDGFGFVTNEQWDNDHLYNYCRAINQGFCPLWTPRKNGDET